MMIFGSLFSSQNQKSSILAGGFCIESCLIKKKYFSPYRFSGKSERKTTNCELFFFSKGWNSGLLQIKVFSDSADECYSPAESALIEEDSILLSSSKVKHPVSVRYAWSDNSNNILYNWKIPVAAFTESNKDNHKYDTL